MQISRFSNKRYLSGTVLETTVGNLQPLVICNFVKMKGVQSVTNKVLNMLKGESEFLNIHLLFL